DVLTTLRELNNQLLKRPPSPGLFRMVTNYVRTRLVLSYPQTPDGHHPLPFLKTNSPVATLDEMLPLLRRTLPNFRSDAWGTPAPGETRSIQKLIIQQLRLFQKRIASWN